MQELNILQNEVEKGKIVVLISYEENQRNRITFANQLANLSVFLFLFKKDNLFQNAG